MDSDAYVKAIEFIDGLDQRYPENHGAGWVYVMRNQELRKSLLKIGMTTRPPHERASELGASTSTPGEFQLIYFVHVCEARAAEQYVHETLASQRYQPNKEFFSVSIGRGVRALDQAAQAFPLLRSQRNKGSRNPRSKPIPQAFPLEIRTCSDCGKKNRVRALAIKMTPNCGECSRPLG